jgi:hypothetical protein
LGVQLSAFSLKYEAESGKEYFLESIFQASKVFERGGPYTDIKNLEPIQAKRDERLMNSGRLIAFVSAKVTWPLEPKTLFYDWLYVNTIKDSKELTSQIQEYGAFTDIEFNPKKSVNCQAYSAALYVSLVQRGLIGKALGSKISFAETVQAFQAGDTQNSSNNLSLL